MIILHKSGYSDWEHCTWLVTVTILSRSTLFRYRQSLSGWTHPPKGLLLLCLIISVALMWPLGYLFLRASEVDMATLQGLWTRRTGLILGRSLLMVLAVNAGAWLVALPLAWILVYADIPGRRVWTVLVAMPLVVPSYIGAYGLIAMYGPRGLLQNWLAPLGVERIPSLYGFPGTLVALILFTYPYLFLGLRSALMQVDQSWIDASRTLGHGVRRTFWHVLFPAIRPALAAGSILVSLYVLSDFGAVSLLRYNTFTRAIYVLYQSSLDRHQAALLTLILVCLTVLLLWLELGLRGKYRMRRSHAGSARIPARIPLGKWQYLAWPLLGGVVFMGLVNPILVSSIWLHRGIRAGEALNPVLVAVGNSVYVSVLAAAVAVVLAVPLSYVRERYASLGSRLAVSSAYIGFGMPGIAVALSLVFFGARHAPWIYQTLALLLLGYMVRYVSLAVGPIRSQLAQTNPRMEEAGRLLGFGVSGVLMRVTAPVLRGSMLTGAALVYLTTMKELPVTLILGPTGFSTLATRIWSATEEAFFARAAAPTLILLLISALGIALIFSAEDL